MKGRAKATAICSEPKRKHSVSQKRNAAFSKPMDSSVSHILFLQRTIGNQGVQRLFNSSAIQAKLKIGQPGDKYEQEADQVMGMPEPLVQRQPEEEEEEETLQSKETPDQNYSGVTPDIESRIQSLKRGGKPLPESIRTFFEPRFGVDFSKVRIHTDTQAAENSKALNARAFTVGHNLIFGAGQYTPYSNSGRKLLSHELTHVVQQGAGKRLERKSVGHTAELSIRQHTNCSRIQRWGLSDHEKLTESVVKKIMSFFGELKMDKKAVETFKDHCTEMDRRLGAICFNLPAVLIGSHEKLVKHYKANKGEAENHGEGGLYSYNLPKARRINLAKQEQYEKKACEYWQSTKREFSSFDECMRTKSAGREGALNALGYALHIAQDRGAHGEGAIGHGHDKPNFEPDNPGVNKDGWKHAQQNTELVVLRASDMLYKVLDQQWSRTCAYTTPAKISIIRK